MKKIIICSALLFAFFSCSKEQQTSTPVNPTDATAIDFNSSLNMNIVRGTPVEGTKLCEDFGVFGYCDKNREDDINLAMEHLDPDFMYNQKVDYHSGHNPYFSYSPLCYWPTTGWINFFAYTPYHHNSHDEFVHPKNSHDKGYPIIKYKVCKDVEDQEDLMVAQALKQVGTSKSVHFDFQHILTKVGVEACLDSNCGDDLTVYIKKVKFKNIKDEGEFYYSHIIHAKDTWWTCVEGSEDYTIGLNKGHDWRDILDSESQSYNRHKFDGVVIENGGDCYTRVNDNDDYLLAIPQCFTGNCRAVLEVTYVIYDNHSRKDKEYTVEIPLKDSQCWEPGACIDYVICIELNAVKFDVKVTPWEDCEEIITETTPSSCETDC